MKKLLIGLALVPCYFFSAHSDSYYQSAERNMQVSDSLQQGIDSLFNTISLYDDMVFQKKEVTETVNQQKKLLEELSDSLVSLHQFKLTELCTRLSAGASEKTIKENLRNNFREIDRCEQAQQAATSKMSQSETLLKELTGKIGEGEKKYNENRKHLHEIALGLTGPGKLIIKGVSYRFYIAHLPADRVQVHNNPYPGRGQSLQQVKERLQKQGDEVIILTNGGMYTPGYGAQGLLIENGKQINKLDTLKPSNDLNFYMQPNGVFFIDSAGYHLLTTDAYKKITNRQPLFATQSGPMLVTGGKRNSKFNKRSTHFYIRSGVGLIRNGKIVFVISDKAVNFYEFSTVFTDIFGCTEALYLDGAISEMYINDQYSRFPNPVNNERFGPVISITTTKK